MKLIKIFNVIIVLFLLVSCQTYKSISKIDKEELVLINNNPDNIIFMDYYSMNFQIEPIQTKKMVKYDKSNIFEYDKFEGFIESNEDAKIYLIYLNDETMFILKKSQYYSIKLKENDTQMKYIKFMYNKHLKASNLACI